MDDVSLGSTDSKLTKNYIRIKRLTHISTPKFSFPYNHSSRSKLAETFEMKLFQGKFRNYKFDATDHTGGLLSSQIRYEVNIQNHRGVEGAIHP